MKKHFLTGLAILLPLVLTIIIFVILMHIFTAPFLGFFTTIIQKNSTLSYWFKTYPEPITFIIRVFILIFLFVFLIFLGFIGQKFFFRSLLNVANAALSRIPVIKPIYNVSKDVISSLFSAEKKRAFTRAVMVPFPSKESMCVGFISGCIPKQCQKQVKENLISVFLPTAPHPISGYFILFPESEVHEIDMSNEEAVKFTVSCGVIIPDQHDKEKNEK